MAENYSYVSSMNMRYYIPRYAFFLLIIIIIIITMIIIIN